MNLKTLVCTTILKDETILHLKNNIPHSLKIKVVPEVCDYSFYGFYDEDEDEDEDEDADEDEDEEYVGMFPDLSSDNQYLGDNELAFKLMIQARLGP